LPQNVRCFVDRFVLTHRARSLFRLVYDGISFSCKKNVKQA
jgi:hypothetical protein